MASSNDPLFTMPGVATGIDWGAMLDKVMEKAKKPEEVWLRQKDTLELKIGLYKELAASIKQASTALSPLKLESTYSSKQAEFIVLSGGANSNAIVTAEVSSKAAISRHEIEILQKATRETRFSSQIKGTMADAGLTADETFYISIGGKRAQIDVSSSDSLQKVVDKINKATDITLDADGQPKGEALGITARIVDNRIILESPETGLGEKTFSSTITRGADGDPDLLDFSFDKQAPANGKLVVAQGETTYVEGTDFTVEQGSNKITWIDGGNKPAEGSKYKVSYTVNANVYTLDQGDSAQVLNVLGLNANDVDHYIAAQDAEFIVDGMKITRSSNTVNDILEGVTLSINGPGKVTMDISLDAEKAVTSTQEFVKAYNEIMDWINIRLSEELVKNPKSDFERKWGKLHGDSTLWQIKSQLRYDLGNPALIPFTKRTGSQAVLGTLKEEGLTNDTSFTLSVGDRGVAIAVKPEDTLQDVADRINNAHDLRYNSEGEPYSPPLATARVSEDRLVIAAGSGKQASVSDLSGVLGILGMNDPYTRLSQLGISTEKANFGKSGKLEFNTDKFMEAMKRDPEAVQTFMTTVMKRLDATMEGCVSSSTVAVGGTSKPKGRIPSQIKFWEDQISSLDKRISNFDEQLAVRQKRIYKQYTDAEKRLAQLQQQLSWISGISSQLGMQQNNK
ncbi:MULTISPECIES: flagellar filament capping protein FliD [Aminobacterium]|uniref:flagellar filament capping protein FliD n=1 Tax=Aminobacterium TaxID=81466 RepID=UPI00257A9916|nr:flagellar filament capping protein FliD [Aminobacterium sp. UBA4834]